MSALKVPIPLTSTAIRKLQLVLRGRDEGSWDAGVHLLCIECLLCCMGIDMLGSDAGRHCWALGLAVDSVVALRIL